MFTFSYYWNGQYRSYTTDDRIAFATLLESTYGIYFYDVIDNR
jgi:hypothetical protein